MRNSTRGDEFCPRGKTLTIVTSTTNFTGQQFASENFSGNWTGTVNYLSGSITITGLTFVPEPASLILMGLGGMLVMVRRQTR